MFCPKCGDLLSKKDKEAFCLQGEMILSQRLTEKLEESYVTKTRFPRDLPFSFTVGGKWFCPSCGIQTYEESGFLRCPECNLSLNEFIGELVERSSHKE